MEVRELGKSSRIGRAPDNDVILPGPGLPRYHAALNYGTSSQGKTSAGSRRDYLVHPQTQAASAEGFNRLHYL